MYKAEDATEAAVADAATQLKRAAKKLVLVATVQDRAALSAQLGAAAAVDRTKWTDESLAVLDSAIATANALIGDDRATQSDVKAATEAISDAIAGLVEKSTTKPGQGGDKPGSGTDQAQPRQRFQPEPRVMPTPASTRRYLTPVQPCLVLASSPWYLLLRV